MEEMIKFLEKGIDKEREKKVHNVELNVLGVISDEEVKRVNAIHNYAINRINEIYIEIYKKYNEKSESVK